MASEKETQSFEDANVDLDGSEDETQDAKDMRLLGKKQQLRRNFHFWSILAFSCCCMITWSGQLVTFIDGLENGGPEGLVISFFVTWTAFAAIIASLAELMSMWPTSGGQYHWTYTLSPPEWARCLSYFCGWMTVLAWQALVPSVAYLPGTVIQGLIILNYPDYNAQAWQGLLLVYAVIFLTLVLNTFFAKWLPKVEWALLFLYIVGFVVIVVTIIVLSPHKASAHEVFSVFNNGGHWPSDGVSWFVGLQGIVFAWVGADGAIHMSEEVNDAARILPWSLMGSVAINGFLAFGALIAVLFCGGNLLSTVDSPTHYPIIQIYVNATGSISGGTGLTCVMLLTQVAAVFSGFPAATRELWAFARDRGVPGSAWMSLVHMRTKLPLVSIVITTLVALIINLIQLGSSVALNAVVSLVVSGFMASYLLPMSLILYRRIQAIRGQGKELPWGPWALGKWSGVFINAYALTWSVLMMVWSFFPPAPNPDPYTMNWSPLVFGVVVVFALVFWFIDGRKRYNGPVRDAAGGDIEPIVGWQKA